MTISPSTISTVDDPPATEVKTLPPRISVRSAAAVIPVAVCLVIWRLSLTHVNITGLNSYGLPPALPLSWYAALLIAILGTVASITSKSHNGIVMLLYVLALTIILYATVPVLSAQPQYTWVYKHIGVVRYLERTGKADPSIDIYNRWPGFFALGALFSTVAGRPNPETYARWAELFFILLDLTLIAAIVKVVARDIRVSAGAALFFLLLNWVGQTYYSPQAFTYVLGLALLLVALKHLHAHNVTIDAKLGWFVERLSRRPQLDLQESKAATWPRWSAIVVVLALDAIIVASHQLTPYMLLGSMLLLLLAGRIRPWWVLLAMSAMTLAYFALNFNYIESNFGVFSSIDPFRNAEVTPFTQTPAAGKVFNTHAELLSILALWIGGFLGIIRLARSGLFLRAIPITLLAFAPLGVIFGQNYGGEASLRIVLFSSPWLAALIAWAICTARRPVIRRATMSLAAIICSGLFIVSYFGQEELNFVSPAEIRASAWFYHHARHGSVLMLSAPGFPLKYGGTYPDFRGPEGDAFPNLLSSHLFQNRQLGAAQLPDLIGQIHIYARRGYLSFSKDETAFAEVMRLTPPLALAHLERAVGRSPAFRLSYSNPDVSIYELTGAPATNVAANTPAPARPGRKGHPRHSRYSKEAKPYNLSY